MAVILLLIISVLVFLPAQGPVFAVSSPQIAFSGRAVIEGPVQLEIAVTPPVTTPGQTINVQVRLTNNQPSASSPSITLYLPSNLNYTDTRLPAGATYSFADNTLTWRPLLTSPGATVELNLTLNVGSADITTPEKDIGLTLLVGEQVQTAAVPIWIGLAPQATIQVQPGEIAVGQPVRLFAVTQGTGPFTQSWNFGDGRHITTPNPQIVFPVAGTYQITLLLSNPLGAVETSTSITVENRPVAAFTVESDKAIPFAPVQFTNQSGGEPPLTYLWEFGDGTTSNEPHPVHQFPAPGYYPVQLFVNSPLGSAEFSQTMIIGNSPNADFMIDAEVSTGTPLRAEAIYDATVAEIEWDMGDGTIYTTNLVQHIYHKVGPHNVTLVARNEYGEISITKEIMVTAGIFESYLPTIHRRDVSRPAVLGPVPERTPPQYFGLVYSDPIGAVENPGGAGPGDGELPAAVMPQVENVPSTTDVTGIPIEQTVDQPPANITLPPQTPLTPNATPAEGLLWYINEARRLHNLPPLLYSYELSIAAQVHTEDMLYVPGILHVGSDGSRPEQRQYRFGWGGYYAGEAVAWGWESPLSVVEFWVNSPPHRVIVLNPNATHVGVGYAANANAPNIWYWTAELGLSLVPAGLLPPSPQ